MSGPARTSGLRLVDGAQGSVGGDRLSLPDSERLVEFLAAAALLGLERTLAVRLGLERALVLEDAQELGVDVERARRALSAEARGARVRIGVGPNDAAYLRRLNAATEVEAPQRLDGFSVALPEKLMMRTRGRIDSSALHAGAVEEMVAWERAAILGGRTMGEWAVLALASRLRS